MKRLSYLAAFTLLMTTSCLYGIFVHRNHLPPYQLSKTIYRSIMNKDKNPDLDPIFNTIPQYYFETEVKELISVHTGDDILKMKNTLIDFIWGNPGIPTKVPSQIDKDFKDKRYKDLTSLKKIDQIVIKMEFGLKSHIYHFLPQNSNNKMVLFHQGHGGDFIKNKEFIAQLLDYGYSISAFCMPLLGLNNQPVVFLPRFGYLKIASHNHMKFLNPKNGHPIKFFIEPIVITLNYIDKYYDYSHIAMAGISGGGWTTTLAAAIDSRIQSSFPVAGTYPIYLRSEADRDWGDWEQTIPELYQIANYLEMYILGAYGKGRNQLQVINKYDSCCFAGIKWQTYMDIVNSYINSLGLGNWDLFLDDSHHSHMISNVTREKIITELEASIVDSR